MGSTREFVVEIGEKLNRTAEDVESYILILEENWYDTKESLADASAPELTSLGIPQRFAKELTNALQQDQARSDNGDSRHDGKSKGKGGKSTDKGGKSKGKGGKAKGKDGKSKGKDGKSKGKGSRRQDPDSNDAAFIHSIDLEIADCDPAFPFREKIIGDKACNIRHIRDKTGANVWLRGKGSGFKEVATGKEADEPMHVFLTSDNEWDLEMAVSQTSDLLQVVFDEYDEWQKRSEGHKRSLSSKGKGSKGKGEFVSQGNSHTYSVSMEVVETDSGIQAECCLHNGPTEMHKDLDDLAAGYEDIFQEDFKAWLRDFSYLCLAADSEKCDAVGVVHNCAKLNRLGSPICKDFDQKDAPDISNVLFDTGGEEKNNHVRESSPQKLGIFGRATEGENFDPWIALPANVHTRTNETFSMARLSGIFGRATEDENVDPWMALPANVHTRTDETFSMTLQASLGMVSTGGNNQNDEKSGNGESISNRAWDMVSVGVSFIV